MAEKGTRTRSWTFIVYPESAPEGWRDVLDELHLEWVESPLHDQDLNPPGAAEKYKKPHWHVLICFRQVKAYEQVLELIKPLNCTIPQRCHNTKTLVRYMAHLDHPDKAQYKISDIVAHGGIDVSDLLRASASERYEIIRDMCNFVTQQNITEFYQLMDFAMAEKFDTWFPLLCDNSAYIVTQYIKSNRLRISNEAWIHDHRDFIENN